MDESSSNKDQLKPSLFDLLKKYTTRVDERETLWKEGTRACQQQQKAQTNEIGKLKETVSKLQSRPTATSASSTPQTSNLVEDKTPINYKSKWEEAEAKCRVLEKKCQRLETETVKQLQTKIDQLQRDSHQMKLIKESIAEICSCRQLTNAQIEQLKSLANNNNSNSLSTIETIANKADFHQQTLKLREIIVKNNEEFLNRIEQVLKKKRKRDQDEDDLTNNDDNDYE